MGSQVNAKDRSQLIERETVDDVRRKGKMLVVERRREHTVLGLDLHERGKQVASHASALVLAMTDEARREA